MIGYLLPDIIKVYKLSYFPDVPLCNRSEPRKIGSVIGRNVTIVCDVDAYPKETTYQWWFMGQDRKQQRRMLNVHGQTMMHGYLK
jgi:hypothetical protein